MGLICNDIASCFILTAKLIIFLETTPLFQFFCFLIWKHLNKKECCSHGFAQKTNPHQWIYSSHCSPKFAQKGLPPFVYVRV